MDLIHRGRRLRISAGIRSIVRENHLLPENLIYPLFVVEGTNIKEEIPSISGQYHFSVDMLEDELDEIVNLGIPAVLLFGLPAHKDEKASKSLC